MVRTTAIVLLTAVTANVSHCQPGQGTLVWYLAPFLPKKEQRFAFALFLRYLLVKVIWHVLGVLHLLCVSPVSGSAFASTQFLLFFVLPRKLEYFLW